MMKSLRSTFAAVAVGGLLFSAAASAFAAPKDYQITGTVSELTDTTVTLMSKTKEAFNFARTADTKLPDGAKVGDKVTVHYTMTAGTVDAKSEAAPAGKKEKSATTTKTSKKSKGEAATEPAASGSPSKPAAEAASPTP